MSLATATEVCNMALDHLGKPNITSVDEPKTDAIRCKRQLPMARGLVLAFAPWSFARKTVALAPVDNSREQEWGYAYDMPGDVATFYRLAHDYEGEMVVNDDRIPHEVEGGKLFANISDARLRYIYDNENVPMWSALFTDAVALKLAVRLAPSMTRSRSVKTDLQDEYENVVRLASEHDALNDDTRWPFAGYSDYRDGGRQHSAGPGQPDGSTIWGS